jgi:hypothetical protein
MSEPAMPVRHALSADGMTLVIKRRAPGGILTTTYHRDSHAGPFTDADVDQALRYSVERHQMQTGQRNRARRTTTRFGTLWTHVNTGPPTWWLPRAKREKDGTVMAGWFRLAVAARFDRPPEGGGQR